MTWSMWHGASFYMLICHLYIYIYFLGGAGYLLKYPFLNCIVCFHIFKGNMKHYVLRVSSSSLNDSVYLSCGSSPWNPILTWKSDFFNNIVNSVLQWNYHSFLSSFHTIGNYKHFNISCILYDIIYWLIVLNFHWYLFKIFIKITWLMIKTLYS